MTRQCKTRNKLRFCWDKPKDPTKIRDPVLRNLNQIAMEKSRSFTKLPVRVDISTELPHKILKRGGKPVLEHIHAIPYEHAVHPIDKRIKKLVVGHGVYLDKTYYNKFRKKDPYKLEQTILHELAHIVIDKDRMEEGRMKEGAGHTPQFRKAARELGCDKEHISAIDDTVKLTKKEKREILKSIRRQRDKEKREQV
jgi:hypothetical protein